MRLQGNYNQRNNIGVCRSFFRSLIYATTSTDFYRMFVERTITTSPFCEFIHGKRLCSFLYIFSNDTYKTSIFKNNLVEIRLPTITGDIEQNKVSSKVKPRWYNIIQLYHSPKPLGWGEYWFLRSIETRIDRYKRLLIVLLH